MTSERRRAVLLYVLFLCWLWIAGSMTVYRFQHPELTETQLLLAWREWLFEIRFE